MDSGNVFNLLLESSSLNKDLREPIEDGNSSNSFDETLRFSNAKSEPIAEGKEFR